MSESGISSRVNEFVATLIELFRHQSRREIVELLENSRAQLEEINYDNWNGGTYTWALRLYAPVHIFALVEPNYKAIEKEIAEKMQYFVREYPNDVLGEVTIVPLALGAANSSQRMAPPELEVRRLWSDGRFRLFLSHLSGQKDLAAALKNALWLRGVNTFVAHADIEPSLEWQEEIELALKSMHALAALLTTCFHESKWTDQEVGWAMGRGVLVVPLKVQIDPYGLMGKFQGVPGNLEHPRKLAVRIAKTLLANRQTQGEMRRAILNSLTTATSHEMAIALSDLLTMFKEITEDERTKVWDAVASNPYVSGAGGVREKLYLTFGQPTTAKTKFQEDDVPF